MLRCNYNEKFLKGTTLPLFYRSILQYFLELKTAHKCVNGQELVLFNNKDILIENQTIFHKDWFQKEIFLIQDLLKDDGKFFTYPEFVRRYELKCNFLTYMQVVSAIPKHLIKKAKGKTFRQEHLSSRRCFPTLAQYCNRPTQNEKQGLLLDPN